MRRGLVIAQDSGNRAIETHLAVQSGPTRGRTRRPAGRARLLRCGDPQLPRLGQHHHDPCRPGWPRRPFRPARALRTAATIAGFAVSPLTAAVVPEINTAITHLRDVLGDETYESLARKGETMTTAAMVTYAYDQIDQVKAELKAVSK